MSTDESTPADHFNQFMRTYCHDGIERQLREEAGEMGRLPHQLISDLRRLLDAYEEAFVYLNEDDLPHVSQRLLYIEAILMAADPDISDATEAELQHELLTAAEIMLVTSFPLVGNLLPNS